jgi:hypothetical protein
LFVLLKLFNAQYSNSAGHPQEKICSFKKIPVED